MKHPNKTLSDEEEMDAIAIAITSPNNSHFKRAIKSLDSSTLIKVIADSAEMWRKNAVKMELIKRVELGDAVHLNGLPTFITKEDLKRLKPGNTQFLTDSLTPL